LGIDNIVDSPDPSSNNNWNPGHLNWQAVAVHGRAGPSTLPASQDRCCMCISSCSKQNLTQTVQYCTCTMDTQIILHTHSKLRQYEVTSIPLPSLLHNRVRNQGSIPCGVQGPDKDKQRCLSSPSTSGASRARADLKLSGTPGTGSAVRRSRPARRMETSQVRQQSILYLKVCASNVVVYLPLDDSWVSSQ
jgi:hypothetical protein